MNETTRGPAVRQPHKGGRLPDGHELISIAESDERFKVRRRSGMAALNYVYVTDDPEQFAWPRSEMRGLIVDENSGRVLARPFQKFWNANEKHAAETDWREAHVLLPKFDGSLVYPAGERWVTRGGITDTSLRTESVAAKIGAPLAVLLEATRTDPADRSACTPCFEYIGPDNRIVIAYERTRLVLLAVRRISDGEYWPMKRVIETWERTRESTGRHDALDIVRPLSGLAVGRPGTAEYTRRLTETIGGWSGRDNEGIVVAFEPSGHRVKIKSREYVALHRARDDYSRESRVLQVWSDGNHQALLEQLTSERAARLASYYDRLEARIADRAHEITRAATAAWRKADGNRKDAAIAWSEETEPDNAARAVGFTVFTAIAQNRDAEAAAGKNMREVIARACGRQSRIEAKVHPMLGPDAPIWSPSDGSHHDAEE